MNPFARKKVLVFGALGAAGCLLGWAAGEGLLAAALPARTENGGAAPSLASRPEAAPKPEPPKLEPPVAAAPPRPRAPEIAAREAPKPAAPVPVAPNVLKAAAPPLLPPEFQKRLDAAGGKSGQLQFTLIWNNRNDLDLHCVDPNGEEIFFSNKKASKGSGGHLDVDRNVQGETTTPVENIYFPTGAPLGRYRVYVNHYSNKGDADPTEFSGSALVGDQRAGFQGKITHGDKKLLVLEADLPGLRLAVPAEVVLYPDGANTFRVRLERDRNAAAVRLTFAGDAAGLTLPAEVTVPADRDEAEIEVSAGGAPGTRKLRVVAEGKFGKAEAPLTVTVAPLPAGLQIGVPDEVVLFPGGKNQFRVRLLRFNHDGPVELALTGDAAGLTLPEPVTVPGAGAEATFELAAPRPTAAGTRTLKLVAKGKHGEASEPLRLTVQVPPAALQIAVAKSVPVQPGGEVLVTVLVARDWYEGPVKVRGSTTNRSVTAWDATIPADRDSVELKVTAQTDAAEGAFPLTLTASGGTARAEASTSLEIALPPAPVAAPVAPAARWSWKLVLVIGLWTALLAVGLSLALAVGQNRYLARPWLSGRQALVLVAGGGLAGLVAGGIGQTLFGLMARGGALPEAGFLAGWLLLGGLLGRGVGFFVPNLNPWRAALAGVAGGFLGAVAFILISKLGDTAGRLVGAGLLGLCIGLMVALVEAAFRTAWLEVRYSASEVVTVNLGPEPVKIGGDSRACTIWARGAAPVALRFWIRDGKVVCEDAVNRTTGDAANGSRHRAGTLEVVVRTGAGGAGANPVPEVARPARPVTTDDDYDPLPMPVAAKPPVPGGTCPKCRTKVAAGKRSCLACDASW